MASLSDTVNYLSDTSPGFPQEQVLKAVLAVRDLACAYTRGQGFTGNWANDEIASVITLAAGRYLRNPGQLAVQETMGPFTVDYRGGFTGWSLTERETLNRYRTRAV